MAIDDWRITLLLADAAQVADGKLFIIGGGWQFMSTPLSPHAVAGLISVPWSETNRKHRVTVALQGEDGQPIRVAVGQEEAKPLDFWTEFELGRPAGVKPGTALNIPFSFLVGPLPLPPGRYVWVCTLDKETPRDDWRLVFDVRA